MHLSAVRLPASQRAVLFQRSKAKSSGTRAWLPPLRVQVSDGGGGGGSWPSWRFLYDLGSRLHRDNTISKTQRPQSEPNRQDSSVIIGDVGCPLECLPGTPTEVIRALAPAQIASAAGAVRTALRHDSSSSGSGSSGAPHGAPSATRELRSALTRLRAGLSETAYEAFCNEVEAAALRAALQYPQYPQAGESLMSLASLGSMMEEEDDADQEVAAVAAAAAATHQYKQPHSPAVGFGGGHSQHPQQLHHHNNNQQQQLQQPFVAWAQPPHHHRTDSGSSSTSSSASSAPDSITSSSYRGQWDNLFRSGGFAATNGGAGVTDAGSHRPTVVGAHPITVLPAFSSADAVMSPAGATTTRSSSCSSSADPHPSSKRRTRRSSTKRPSSPSSPTPRTTTPHFTRIVFGGGGARTLAYAGAVHALRTLGLVRRLDCVAGASGGAILAVLAALGLGPQEVLTAMGSLPDPEQLSWVGLATNRNLGLASGTELFNAIEQVRAFGGGGFACWAQQLRLAKAPTTTHNAHL